MMRVCSQPFMFLQVIISPSSLFVLIMNHCLCAVNSTDATTGAIIIDPKCLDHLQFGVADCKTHHPDVEELEPSDDKKPEPNGKKARIVVHKHSNHVHNLVTKRSITFFQMNWMAVKKQNSIHAIKTKVEALGKRGPFMAHLCSVGVCVQCDTTQADNNNLSQTKQTRKNLCHSHSFHCGEFSRNQKELQNKVEHKKVSCNLVDPSSKGKSKYNHTANKKCPVVYIIKIIKHVIAKGSPFVTLEFQCIDNRKPINGNLWQWMKIPDKLNKATFNMPQQHPCHLLP